MGKESSKDTNKRYAVQGPKDNPDPHIARQAALREAVEFVWLGFRKPVAAGAPTDRPAPGGRETHRVMAAGRPRGKCGATRSATPTALAGWVCLESAKAAVVVARALGSETSARSGTVPVRELDRALGLATEDWGGRTRLRLRAFAWAPRR